MVLILYRSVNCFLLYVDQSKEAEAKQLADELGEARTAEAQKEAHSNSDLRKLHREIELMKEQHRQEVGVF